MTEERDFDRLARAWLELGPDQAPDRAIAAVLQAVETTPQVRSRPWRLPPWRFRPVNRTLSVAALAAAIIVIAGAAFWLSRPNTTDVLPGPAASASPIATPAASASPIATPAASASAVIGKATAIAAGDTHTCAITHEGAVKCWGENFYGQLGNGSTTDSIAPVTVSGLTSGVVAISAGYSHTCVVTSGGGVKCWGLNVNGQLGNGDTAGNFNTKSTNPVGVSGLASSVIAIAAGDSHTCALTDAGSVKCWGSNVFGALGDGTTADTAVPVDVSGLTSGVTAIATALVHSCALTSAGGAKCWGWNRDGELGNGRSSPGRGAAADPAVDSVVPVDVSGLASGVTAIAPGATHTCAVTGGGVKCWGANAVGQLGNGTRAPSSTPVDVVGLASGVTAITSDVIGPLMGPDLGSNSCALTTAGTVKCWGRGVEGQLGNGTKANSTTPVDVSGLSDVTAITTRGAHTCALTSDGGVQCWGRNGHGQLGDGTTTDSSTPVVVSVL